MDFLNTDASPDDLEGEPSTAPLDEEGQLDPDVEDDTTTADEETEVDPLEGTKYRDVAAVLKSNENLERKLTELAEYNKRMSEWIMENQQQHTPERNLSPEQASSDNDEFLNNFLEDGKKTLSGMTREQIQQYMDAVQLHSDMVRNSTEAAQHALFDEIPDLTEEMLNDAKPEMLKIPLFKNALDSLTAQAVGEHGWDEKSLTKYQTEVLVEAYYAQLGRKAGRIIQTNKIKAQREAKKNYRKKHKARGVDPKSKRDMTQAGKAVADNADFMRNLAGAAR